MKFRVSTDPLTFIAPVTSGVCVGGGDWCARWGARGRCRGAAGRGRAGDPVPTHLRGCGARPPYLWMQFPWQRAAGRGSSPVLRAPLPRPRRPAPGWTPPPVAPASPRSASPLRPPRPPGPNATGTRGRPAAAAPPGDPAARPWLAVPGAATAARGMEVRRPGRQALPAAAPAASRGSGGCGVHAAAAAPAELLPAALPAAAPPPPPPPRRPPPALLLLLLLRQPPRRSQPAAAQVEMACFGRSPLAHASPGPANCRPRLARAKSTGTLMSFGEESEENAQVETNPGWSRTD